MNVRLSVGRLWNIGKGMRTAGWCMVYLGMVTASAAVAENAATTRTVLSVASSDAGPRTRMTLSAHVTATDLSGSPSGVVTFRSGNLDRSLDLGSAFLDGEGNASLQTDILPAGDHKVVAIYKGQPSFQASLSSFEKVHAQVTTVAGFTIAASPTSLSAAVGGFVNSIITVTPVNGFSGYVSLSCKGLPINTTCTFTPVSVPATCTAGAGGTETCTPGSSVMQIQTLSPSPATTASNQGDSQMRRYAFIFPAVCGLVGLGAGRRRAWRNLALGMLAFACTMGMTACSQRYNYLNHGPPGNPGTPVGTYTVTVEAQSSTGGQTTTPPTLPQIALTITAPKN